MDVTPPHTAALPFLHNGRAKAVLEVALMYLNLLFQSYSSIYQTHLHYIVPCFLLTFLLFTHLS